MPFSKRVNVIETEFVRVRPDIYAPENPYDAYVDAYELNVYEGEPFSVGVRDAMVLGNPAPQIEITPDDSKSDDIAVIRGETVSGTAPEIRVFERNFISLTVKAEN